MLSALLAVLLSAASPPEREGPNAPAESGVVLLDNGSLLEGEITRSDDYLVISTPTSQIRVRLEVVLTTCRNRLEAYDFQRLRIRRSTATSHLDLAQWCLRHELWPQAARELMDARALDDSLPRIELLEQQLEVATSVNTAPDSGRDALVRLNDRRRAERKRLEAVPDGLSPEALQLFTRKVQPILVNSCAASGCHRANETQAFQLDRALLHGQGNRQATLRNLAATLELIDDESPQRSPLLTVPIHPHGGEKNAVFGPRQQQLLEQVASWVRLVSKDDELGPAADDGQGVQTAVWEIPAGTVDRSVGHAVYDATVPLDALPDGPGRATRNKGRPRPIDPFDPAVFNRRFAGRSGKTSARQEPEPESPVVK